MSFEQEFTKDNLDIYLKELAKELRKIDRSGMPVEIILVGGAAILENYGFRNATKDIDAVFRSLVSVKDAVNRVGDRFNLPNGWLNMDFIRTCSYSPKLYEISRYYKTFSHILEVRTVSAEYLIAMKMRAGRRYKNDVSDIIGIFGEHENSGTPITMERIDMAVKTLYGGWDSIDPWLKLYVEQAMTEKNYSEKYQETRQTEMKSKELLVGFQQDYPDVLNDENANKIAESLGSASAKREEKRASVIEKLRSPASQDNSNTKKRDNGMEHDR